MIAFCLLGKKGYESLNAILAWSSYSEKLKIEVIVGRDSAVVSDYSSDIISLCEENSIDYQLREMIVDYSGYQYVFAIGWRWLIQGVMPDKLIVFHDSLLPQYRGFAPLVNAALNMESKVGVSALFGVEGFDEGDLLGQRSIDVAYPIRISRLIDLIAIEYSVLVLEIYKKLQDGSKLLSVPQGEVNVTYSPWLDKIDYFIDWSDSAKYIANKINLLGEPYSHAKTLLDDDEVIIVSAELVVGEVSGKGNGKVIVNNKDGIVVACGSGLIKITCLKDQFGADMLPLNRLRTRLG